jgi:rhamnogalacturonyl hydrolase YesR
MENLFELLIAGAVGYYIGSWVKEQVMLIRMVRNAKETIKYLEHAQKVMEEVEADGIPEDAIEVKIERVNDLVYAYNKVTGEFLAQAQSLHQAMLLAAKRYPGKKFWHPELTQDSQTA